MEDGRTYGPDTSIYRTALGHSWSVPVTTVAVLLPEDFTQQLWLVLDQVRL